ncbi:hypothetical protein BU196_10725, partial [Streptomyces sp. CBMA370]|nr:hypothetical protein [Streptomyces sp. CBMA370]
LSGPEQDLAVRELLAGHIDLGKAGLGSIRWPDELRACLTTRGRAGGARARGARCRAGGPGPGPGTPPEPTRSPAPPAYAPPAPHSVAPEDDVPEADDPDLVDSALSGHDLIVRELGATVVEEYPNQ